MKNIISFLINVVLVIISTCLQWEYVNNPFVVLVIVYVVNILINYFVNKAEITDTYKKYILLESALYTLGACSNINFIIIGITIPWSSILKALSPVMITAITKWLPIIKQEEQLAQEKATQEYYDKILETYENLYIDIEN